MILETAGGVSMTAGQRLAASFLSDLLIVGMAMPDGCFVAIVETKLLYPRKRQKAATHHPADV
jgi:hypothetical protein